MKTLILNIKQLYKRNYLPANGLQVKIWPG